MDLLPILCFACLGPAAGVQDAPRAVIAERSFDFGRVMLGSVLNHAYTIKNDGSVPLLVRSLRMTPPLIATRMPAHIPPGDQASIVIRLDTAKAVGPFSGQVAIEFSNAGLGEELLFFNGYVCPPIELLPLPAFFVATQRGQPGQQSIEIINHEQQPLQILKLEHSQERFTTQLDTLEAGRRYRLSLNMKPSGQGGKHTEVISIYTSSATMPLLRVPANTYWKDRVYFFPGEIDLGALPISLLRTEPSAASKLAQVLMVYQEGGSDFEAEFTSDLPMLRVTAERGPKGDRFQATIELIPNLVRIGPMKGKIFIHTNDPDFPEISVPVTGTILD